MCVLRPYRRLITTRSYLRCNRGFETGQDQLRHHALCQTSRRGLPVWYTRRENRPIQSNQIEHQALQQQRNPGTNLTGAGVGLGPSPAPHCSPHRAPGLPGDGGTPAASIFALSCHSTCPCCACWSSQAVMEDSGGPGATSHTQAKSRTSKDERFRMGTCSERTRRSKNRWRSVWSE